MSTAAEYEAGEEITAIIRGQVHVASEVADGYWCLLVRTPGGKNLWLDAIAGVDGVEIRRGAPPIADDELVERALRDAVAYYETGCAARGCPACDRNPEGIPCSEHDPRGPVPDGYRERLAELAG